MRSLGTRPHGQKGRATAAGLSGRLFLDAALCPELLPAEEISFS